jgi:3-oxosteroid 1-dehydrogenase
MTAGLGIVATTPELTAMLYYNRSVRGLFVSARVLVRTLAGKVRGQALVSNGGALTGRLLERVVDLGAEIWLEAPLQELIVEHGEVVGAIVRRGGKERRVAARHGVLLAAGGFSRNDEMRKRYGGQQATSAEWSVAGPGDTGEVLQAAMAIGAATDLLDEAVWIPMPRRPDGSLPAYPSRRMLSFSRFRWRPGTIMVDAAGRRFANESMSYMELGQLMFARDRQVRSVPSWLIFDDSCRRRSLFGVLPGRLPEQWIRDGFILRAGTLAELATQCGVDPAGLEATVQRFNGFARTGVDTDFHRGESAADRFAADPSIRPNSCLAPLDRSPFYAVAMYPCDVGTSGGLLTDGHARVLGQDGRPIPGLYAAGNITASVMGRRYLGAGGNIGPACTFGFVAMQHLASRASRGHQP